MKSHTSLITLIAALLYTAGIPALAKSENTHPMMFRVNEVVREGATLVKFGSTESAVWYQFGSPDAKPAKNVWVYHNFRSSNERALSHECHSLMITFENDRVADIVLVNSRAKTVIVAELAKNPHYLADLRTRIAQR